MSEKYFVVPHSDGATEIPLFQIAQSTKWSPASPAQGTRPTGSVFGFDSVKFVSEQTEIKQLLNRVFGIIGVLVHDRSLFFIVSVPTQNCQFHIYAIKYHHKYTHTINCNLEVPHMLKNLSCPLKWKVPFLRITEIFINEEFDIYTLFAIQGNMRLVGHDQIRQSDAILKEYNDHVTGKKDILLLDNKQQEGKRKRDYQDHSSIDWMVVKTKFTKKSNAVITSKKGKVVAVPQHITHQLNANRPPIIQRGDPGYIPNYHFGVRSHDNGGRSLTIPLTPVVRVTKRTPRMSEMHVTMTTPGAFMQQHSIETILFAVDELKQHLLDKQCSAETSNKILGAVSSLLLEDISWQLSDSPVVPHHFASIKVDIDQVSFHAISNFFC
jgi:hypothetical protein